MTGFAARKEAALSPLCTAMHGYARLCTALIPILLLWQFVANAEPAGLCTSRQGPFERPARPAAFPVKVHEAELKQEPEIVLHRPPGRAAGEPSHDGGERTDAEVRQDFQ